MALELMVLAGRHATVFGESDGSTNPIKKSRSRTVDHRAGIGD